MVEIPINCGCKLCKQGLGETINQRILDGCSPLELIGEYETSKSVLRRHLAAFEIPYPEAIQVSKAEVLGELPDLNKIDFSAYDFDLKETESIARYVQKIALKVFLNQAELTIAMQSHSQDSGLALPQDAMKNYAIAFDILDKSTALSLSINQQQAIRTVVNMGYEVSSNAQAIEEDRNTED